MRDRISNVKIEISTILKRNLRHLYFLRITSVFLLHCERVNFELLRELIEIVDKVGAFGGL